MEEYGYPKKPESENRFTEFLRTSKEIEALREAVHKVRGVEKNTTDEPEVVFIEEDVPTEQIQKTPVELRLELEEKLKRYETLKGILADESNPKE